MSKSESRKRTCLVQFRCTPDELAAVQEKAGKASLSVSEFVRRAALQRKIGTKTDRQLICELLRLGGLQKHLYLQMQSAGTMTPELSREFADTLSALKVAVLNIELATEYR